MSRRHSQKHWRCTTQWHCTTQWLETYWAEQHFSGLWKYSKDRYIFNPLSFVLHSWIFVFLFWILNLFVFFIFPSNAEVWHISGCQPLSHRQKIAPLWPHCLQFTNWRSSLFSHISTRKASFDWKKTEPYLATCMQLRQIWSQWISASRPHGRRQPIGRPGDLWWMRQRSRRVFNEKKK